MKTAIIVTDATEATMASGVHYVRPKIAWLAIAMERQMQAHADKGETWRDLTPVEALKRLYEEAGELAEACCEGNPADAMQEAADVANFAWMVASRVAETQTEELRACP